jgi:hypothetical protein
MGSHRSNEGGRPPPRRHSLPWRRRRPTCPRHRP